MTTIEYEETWTTPFAPLIFFLPCFYKYGVLIDNESLLFGYGFRGPGGWTAHRVPREMIDKDSIVTGTASWRDNLRMFGGWGIRWGFVEGGSILVYNASNGPYVEFSDCKGKRYRFVSRDAKKVERVLWSDASESDKKMD